MHGICATNGGVIVELDRTSPDDETPLQNVHGDAHYFGTVVDVGNGVPWLRAGRKVAFLASGATLVNRPGMIAAWLVDQRDVQAVVPMPITESVEPTRY